MTYEINEQALNNLMIFLDRVNIQGLKEISAMNEILTILNNPENSKNNE